MDGQLSVEHQIDVHLRDLVSLATSSSGSPEPSKRGGATDQLVLEVLAGLEYVLLYRLQTGQATLTSDLASRLISGLLLFTGERTGRFFSRHLTLRARLSMHILRKYCQSVPTVRNALLTKWSRDDLRLLLGLRSYLELATRSVDKTSKAPPSSSSSESESDTETEPVFIKELAKSLNDRSCREDALVVAYLLDLLPPSFVLPPSIVPHTESGTLTKEEQEEARWPPPVLHFDRTVDRVLDMYKTDSKLGLDPTQRLLNRQHYGANVLPKQPGRPWYHLLWTQMNDFIIWLLLVSSILSFYLDFPDVTSGLVLLVVVILNVIVGWRQELQAQAALSALDKLQTLQAKVIIDGQIQSTTADTLVPGDIVIIEEGDAVPADLRLIAVNRLYVDESILTGESDPVAKTTTPVRTRSRRLACPSCRSNAFMGTMVVRGSAKGVVVRIGCMTELGQISAALSYTDDENKAETTPLQRQLSFLGKVLVIIAIILCGLIFIVGFWIRNQPLKTCIKVSLSLAVSVIPEGLVAVMTLALASAVKRLASMNCLVKQLPIVEALGSVQVIGSDKTGTLTQGRMAVQRLWTSDGRIYLQNNLENVERGQAWKWSRRIGMLCNTIQRHQDQGHLTGDPTEIALYEFYSRSEDKENMEHHKIISILPFDSDRKMMAICVKDEGSDEKGCTWLCKGAPESILQGCNSYLNVETIAAPIDEQFKGNFERIQAEMSREGLRVLALAFKQGVTFSVAKMEGSNMDSDDDEDRWSECFCDLTFVGLVGLIDPPRKGAVEAIRTCHNAGIEVLMITGDHPTTAVSIALKLGIIKDSNSTTTNNFLMTGTELDALNDDALRELSPFPKVFARVSPHHKLSIVKALLDYKPGKKRVAMTGDGVNDAPAIKRATVGIAMGRTGTDLARQAAKIVLLDDDFATIVQGIAEGRRVRGNISRFLVYLLACNSAELFCVLVAQLILNLPVPFSAVNILWANIVADVPPSLALGLEPGEPDVMDHPLLSDRILSSRDVLSIILYGTVMTIGSLIVFTYQVKNSPSLELARSDAFFVLTGSQILLVLACRSLKRHLNLISLFDRASMWMLLAVLGAFLLLLAGHYVPIVNDRILELRPLTIVAFIGFICTTAALYVTSTVLKLIDAHLRFAQ